MRAILPRLIWKENPAVRPSDKGVIFGHFGQQSQPTGLIVETSVDVTVYVICITELPQDTFLNMVTGENYEL